MKNIFLLLISLLFMNIGNALAQSKTDDKDSVLVMASKEEKVDLLDDLLDKYYDYDLFNGTVLVAKEGNVIYKKGYGLANVEWDIPNKTNTKFRIASMTKQFTAMLIMQLVAEKKLSLEQNISTYLPDYPKENGEKINIHHLLSHTSGLVNYTSFPCYWDMMKTYKTPLELLSVFSDSTLLFMPGERFSYSNSGYAILGVIIEEIEGKSFGEVLKEKILTPLKMNNTGFEVARDVIKNQASGYDKRGSQLSKSSYIDMSIGYTAGGMYSTVEDLFLWDQALYTEQLLPNEFKEMMFEKHIPAWREHYGYGWMIGPKSIGSSNERKEMIMHDGVVNGFNSMILRFPEDQSSIILLNNTGGALLNEMTRAIAGIIYDKPYHMPKKSIANALLDVIKKDGVTNGLIFFKESRVKTEFTLDEHEMNSAAYELLQSGNKEGALAISKLNVEEFPYSFNAYDSYAEVLMEMGDKEAAIKNYKKSLEFNPENENGIKMLGKLGVQISREELWLLNTESDWGKEIFTFPLNFAKDLSYKGIEEAHFPPGWRKEDSPEFWSYLFAWNIDLNTEINKVDLERDLQIYFEGLSKVVNKNKDFVPPSPIANMNKISESTYEGSIKIHDSFVTNESLTLNLTAEVHNCPEKMKSILLFRFSPAAFDNEIWNTLKGVKLRTSMCKH